MPGVGAALRPSVASSTADTLPSGIEERVARFVERISTATSNTESQAESAVIAGKSWIDAAPEDYQEDRVPRQRKPMNENALEWPLTRRQALTAGFVAGAGLLVGCGSAGKEPAGWTFVDDRKQMVRLPKRPTRIVAYTTAAAALNEWGVTPVGVFGDDPREDPYLAGFPWDESEVVGSVYGEIDLATLLSLKAELIVSQWYPPPSDSPLFGFRTSAAEADRVAGANCRARRPREREAADRSLRRSRPRARSDTMASAIVRARAAFPQSRGEAVRGRETQVEPADHRRLGRGEHDVRCEAGRHPGDLFTGASACRLSRRRRRRPAEQFRLDHAAKYPRIGILYDARSILLPLSFAKEIPAFAALPAVRANQVAGCGDPPPSYQAYAEAMNDLATAIAGWRQLHLTVPRAGRARLSRRFRASHRQETEDWLLRPPTIATVALVLGLTVAGFIVAGSSPSEMRSMSPSAASRSRARRSKARSKSQRRSPRA